LEKKLKANLNLESGTLLYILRDESIFSIQKYNELIYAIYDSNNLELETEERIHLSSMLWEFLFLLLFSLYFDEDANDSFRITDGIDRHKKSELINLLYDIGNNYRRGKEIVLVECLL
jgi:hypothetical protein